MSKAEQLQEAQQQYDELLFKTYEYSRFIIPRSAMLKLQSLKAKITRLENETR